MNSALVWLQLTGAILVFMALFFRQTSAQAGNRRMYKWHPIWKQKNDFTVFGWIMWVGGWVILVPTFFLQAIY